MKILLIKKVRKAGYTMNMGIDQSLNGTAIVILPENNNISARIEEVTSPEKYDYIAKLNYIYTHIAGILWDALPVIVVMEDYSYGSKFNREKLGEVGACVKLAFYKYKMENNSDAKLFIVTKGQANKFLCNKGNLQKSDIKLEVYKKWGLDTHNDNIADAYLLAKIGQAINDIGTCKFEYERKIIQDILKPKQEKVVKKDKKYKTRECKIKVGE